MSWANKDIRELTRHGALGFGQIAALEVLKGRADLAGQTSGDLIPVKI